MRPLLWILLATAATLALSCGDTDPSRPQPPRDPVPGWLQVRLNSPYTDDGGIMFSVRGGQVDSIRSAYSDLFTSQVDSTSIRVIVAGDLSSGVIVAEILVPDMESSANYLATVEQVAARETFLQREASGFSLAVER